MMFFCPLQHKDSVQVMINTIHPNWIWYTIFASMLKLGFRLTYEFLREKGLAPEFTE